MKYIEEYSKLSAKTELCSPKTNLFYTNSLNILLKIKMKKNYNNNNG